MASSTDWLGNEVSFAHDDDGNETAQDNDVSTLNPNGTSSTAFTYDNADENTAATSTLNQSCGQPETLTQSFSGTAGSRNADGQLTQVGDSYSASCSGQTSLQRDYSYDAAGQVVYEGTATQGSNANNFAYDASGDPTTISSHDSVGQLRHLHPDLRRGRGRHCPDAHLGLARLLVDLHLRHAGRPDQGRLDRDHDLRLQRGRPDGERYDGLGHDDLPLQRGRTGGVGDAPGR